MVDEAPVAFVANSTIRDREQKRSITVSDLSSSFTSIKVIYVIFRLLVDDASLVVHVVCFVAVDVDVDVDVDVNK